MENQIATTGKITLPSVDELYNDSAIVIKQNQLNMILNVPPKKEWVKQHPVTKLNYLPIERVEYLLTVLFTKWWVEIIDSKLIANSVVITVRLWVIDPLTGEKTFNDGIGAAPIQTNQGAGAIEFNAMKSSAIQIGAPAAESYAIKDAAEKFGKIFGKDLNRKDEIAIIETLDSKIKAAEESKAAREEIMNDKLNKLTKKEQHV